MLQSIDASSDQERIAEFNRLNTPDYSSLIDEEIHTYGAQARGFIHETGLVGEQLMPTQMSILPYEAFVFIRAGSDELSPLWRKYVEQRTGKEYKSISSK